MGWTTEARYLFDTFGYYVFRKALVPEAKAMASAIAANRPAFVENAAFGVRNATTNTPFAGQGGRLDCGGALQFASAPIS